MGLFPQIGRLRHIGRIDVHQLPGRLLAALRTPLQPHLALNQVAHCSRGRDIPSACPILRMTFGAGIYSDLQTFRAKSS